MTSQSARTIRPLSSPSNGVPDIAVGRELGEESAIGGDRKAIAEVEEAFAVNPRVARKAAESQRIGVWNPRCTVPTPARSDSIA